MAQKTKAPARSAASRSRKSGLIAKLTQSRPTSLFAALIVFFAVAIGGYMIFVSSAATTALEAERMSWVSGNYNINRDDSASSKLVRVWQTNGSASGTLRAAKNFNRIDIRGKANLYGNAAPIARVSVDGKLAGEVQFDSAGWQIKMVSGNWKAGSHKVTVTYINDYRVRGQGDRNLIIDVITAGGEGTTAPTTPPTTTPPTTTPPTTTPTAPTSSTGGSGGAKTDRTFQSYTGEGYTSQYHVYAAGLDWSKPVGALIYADGSGEYGLKNPKDTYLLGGTNGMVNVAKRNNMVLITPLSPNKACGDGDGSCWYMGDSAGYNRWAESLVGSIYKQYPIDKSRVAFGGYSSGAQLATEFWTPSGAAQRTMTDGVIVAISYGGSPKVSQVGYNAAFKANIHMNWNVGSKDPAYKNDGSYGVEAGHRAYTGSGFATSLDVVNGLGHDRDGQFGAVMEAQIKKHVKQP